MVAAVSWVQKVRKFAVMLNLFQHPWTLKQVQGDEMG